MYSLRNKVFIWLLPLILATLFLANRYYDAREKEVTNHIQQLALMYASLGARELEYFFHLREQEFELLSASLSLCEDKHIPLKDKLASTLRLSSGFSAIVSSGPDGSVTHAQLSSNHSNRHVLQRNIIGQPLLPETAFNELLHRYEIWSFNREKNIARKNALLSMEADLKTRGENNSKRYRQLQKELLELRERLKAPYTQVILGGAEQAIGLGLPFNMDTYVFSRPLLNCSSGELLGFYSAFMDRTLLEDLVYSIKEGFLNNGIALSEVLLINELNDSFITQSRLLNPTQLSSLNPPLSAQPEIRQEVQGVALRFPIDTSDALVTKTHHHLNDAAHFPEEFIAKNGDSGISLLVYISAKELQSRCNEIFIEVLIWASLIVLLFTLLIFLLAHNIASPIVHLTDQAEALAKGQHRNKDISQRRDEIGKLWHTFENMAAVIKAKEKALLELATHDPLTGCSNRRALFSYAKEEKHRVARSGGNLFVCMLDLDHFKKINDLYGHTVGDDVLVEFTQTVRKTLRVEDRFCRIGGEEFALLLIGTTFTGAVETAERIRTRVEKLCFTHKNHDFNITVSMGLSEWKKEESFEQALSRSDEYLYRAKDTGRNKIISNND